MSHILVVDDDSSICDVLAKWFAPEFEVVQAYNAAEALRIGRSVNPIAIVIDYYLPDGTGVEVLTRLRKLGVKGYAILMSCSADPLVQPKDWETLRIFDTAFKPISCGVLRRQVHNAIELQESEADLVSYLTEFCQRNSSSSSASLVTA